MFESKIDLSVLETRSINLNEREIHRKKVFLSQEADSSINMWEYRKNIRRLEVGVRRDIFRYSRN